MHPGTLDTDYIKHLPETIRHGFIKHLPRLRDHTARNTAGDPAPIRKGKAARQRNFKTIIGDHAGTLEENLFCYRRPRRNFSSDPYKVNLSSAMTETGTERKTRTPGDRTTH